MDKRISFSGPSQSAAMDHLNHLHLLSNVQNRFRKDRSCETQLSAVIQDIAYSLGLSQQIDAIILDFRRAFDTAPHHRLLYKLDQYDIRGNTLQWIRNFLSNRRQSVVLDGKSSEKVSVIPGVPQGTVLGPLLFLIYINDFPSGLMSTVKLFPDDCILYRPVTHTRDCQVLQEDLSLLTRWEK